MVHSTIINSLRLSVSSIFPTVLPGISKEIDKLLKMILAKFLKHTEQLTSWETTHSFGSRGRVNSINWLKDKVFWLLKALGQSLMVIGNWHRHFTLLWKLLEENFIAFNAKHTVCSFYTMNLCLESNFETLKLKTIFIYINTCWRDCNRL